VEAFWVVVVKVTVNVKYVKYIALCTKFGFNKALVGIERHFK